MAGGQIKGSAAQRTSCVYMFGVGVSAGPDFSAQAKKHGYEQVDDKRIRLPEDKAHSSAVEVYICGGWKRDSDDALRSRRKGDHYRRETGHVAAVKRDPEFSPPIKDRRPDSVTQGPPKARGWVSTALCQLNS